MTPETLEAVFRHAEAEYPREACGLLVNVGGEERFWPCRNISNGQSHFCLHPEDFAAAEDAGTLTAIVHSHPDQVRVHPGEADRVGCEAWGLPWILVGWPSRNVFRLDPDGYCPPYIGRRFDHGTTDCYGLVKDWYRCELGIKLPQIIRPDDWWKEGLDLYRKNVEAAGFRRLGPEEPPVRGDLVLMRIGAKEPNHAGIYQGDARILQHFQDRLSSLDVYGGYFRKVTDSIWRHRDA